ncbi:MAG TPA: MFS transporter [Rhizomicrobium sp.]|nr:MFS transporter [Rhizomicrobium sp.]
MAFFRNNAVNLLNLHYAIHALALTGGGAFFTVYLVRAGVSVPGTMLSLAAIVMGRFVVRPALVGLAVRFGTRRMVMTGSLLSASQYLFLPSVHGVGLPLISMCLVSSLGESLYWTAYHAYFAALGDQEHRGHQISIREAIAAVVGIVSPVIAGWLLVSYGPRVAFTVTALIVATSAVPLNWTPEVPVPRNAPGAWKAAMSGLLLFLADGWIAAGFYFAWQIALFLSLGENFLAYGGALAIAAVVGAVSGMVLGRLIDSGHGRRVAAFSYAVFGLILVLRAVALKSAMLAVAANALGSFGACLYIPTMMTAVYNLAKRSPCTMRFHVVTEAGWDLGAASGLSLSALLVWLGEPLWSCILLSLAGVMAGFAMIWRYYTSHPGAAIQPGIPPVESPAAPV